MPTGRDYAGGEVIECRPISENHDQNVGYYRIEPVIFVAQWRQIKLEFLSDQGFTHADMARYTVQVRPSRSMRDEDVIAGNLHSSFEIPD